MYRIGIDVGGTNTDAVILGNGKVLASAKAFTTSDIITGIRKALASVIEKSSIDKSGISSIMLGTTHFLNALLEQKNLCRVSVIRLGLPSSASIPPMTDWPEGLKKTISGQAFIVNGGFEFDGSPISRFDKKEIAEAVKKIADKGIKSIVVSSVFGPVNNSMEVETAEIIRDIHPDAHITVSSEIASIGLLERENSAILNGALIELAPKIIKSVRQMLAGLGINSPVYLTQNDGTLLTSEIAERFPVLAISSGATNSMRGAAFLSNLDNAAVIDIGGTSSDCGMIINGFPRETSSRVNIAGVKTNFRMPDTISIALGGGSIINPGNLSAGPESVGFRLGSESLIFGGKTLTATDVAVASGFYNLGDKSLVKHLPAALLRDLNKVIKNKLENLLDRIKTCAKPVPLVLVGGGAILAGYKIPGSVKKIIPDHFDAANAVGAAIADVSGETDQVFYIDKIGGHDKAVEKAVSIAKQKTLRSGAEAKSLKVVNIEEISLPYLPGGATRIRVKVTGKMCSRRSNCSNCSN